MSRKRILRPDDDPLCEAQWMAMYNRRVVPRMRRLRKRLTKPNLSFDELLELDRQATENSAIILAGMKPERVEQMLATDWRFQLLAELRKENAALAAKLLARHGIMVMQ